MFRKNRENQFKAATPNLENFNFNPDVKSRKFEALLNFHSRTLWADIRKERWENVSNLIKALANDESHPGLAKAVLSSLNNQTGETVLDIFIQKSVKMPLFNLALDSGLEPRVVPKSSAEGQLPYHEFSELNALFNKGSLDYSLSLLENAVPVNYTDNFGNTPLNLLLRNQRPDFDKRQPLRDVELNAEELLKLAPEHIAIRNHAHELPLTNAVLSQNWYLVRILARAHLKSASELCMGSEEVLAIRLQALLHDAPLDVLHSLDLLSQHAYENSDFSLFPDKFLSCLHDSMPEGFSYVGWRKLELLLNCIEQNCKYVSRDFIGALLEQTTNEYLLDLQFEISENDSSKPTVLIHAFFSKAPLAIMQKILDLGPDLSAPFSYYSSESKLFDCTLMHAVVFEENAELLEMLPHKEQLFDSVNRFGETPIHMYCSFKPSPKLDWVHKLLELHSELDPLDDTGLNISDCFLLSGKFELASKHLIMGGEIPTLADQELYTIDHEGGTEEVYASGVIEYICECFDEASQEVRTEAAQLLNNGGNLTDLYHYAMAYTDATSRVQFQGEHFLKLMPALLWKYPYDQVDQLLFDIEKFHDRQFYPEKTDYPEPHANEAEMLLLLSHPDRPSLDPEHSNFLTRTLTSVPRFIDQVPMIPIDNPVVLQNLARIGVLTHDFLRYKNDARSITSVNEDGKEEVLFPTLFEEFGFRRTFSRDTDFGDPENPTVGNFGKGFLLRGEAFDGLAGNVSNGQQDNAQIALSRDTVIEVRRGYYLVAHPESGALLIRNSSLIFGRDQLDRPAYYLSDALGPNEHLDVFLDLSRETIENGFSYVLDLDLHQPDVESEYSRNIQTLLGQLRIVFNAYRCWKFDTSPSTAFQESSDGKKILVGGWNSPGFSKIVDRLDAWHSEYQISKMFDPNARHMSPPALAMIHPYLPGWSPYTFIDEEGNEQDRLEMNSDRIEVLKLLVKGRATKDDMLNTGIHSFFQVAGMNNAAELVMYNSHGEEN